MSQFDYVSPSANPPTSTRGKRYVAATHHQHHWIVNLSLEEVPVLSEPLEGGVCVPEASSQLLLFGFHHAVHVIQLFLQH